MECLSNELFNRNIPHILEKIFLYLDYESFKKCLRVSKAWYNLLKTDSYTKKAKIVFEEDIWREETNLWSAAEAGNVSKVKRFLVHLVDVNCSRGEFDDTPLIQAAKGRHNIIIQMLLDKGADPNKGNKNGMLPLYATYHAKLFQFHDGDSRKYTVASPKYTAAEYQEIKYGILSAIKVLLKGGASPDHSNQGDVVAPPLSVAAVYDYKDVTKVLLDAGADPNKMSLAGITPLQFASGFGSTDLVKLLLDAGADPCLEGRGGLPPFRHGKAVNRQVIAMYAYNSRRSKYGPLRPVPGF